MNKNLHSALVAFLLLLSGTQATAQNPLTAANGFSVFVKNNLYLNNSNVSKAVAAGGNFKVGGTIASANAGSYTVGSTTAALVVGGSIDWSGNNTVISNGYAKIGNCTGTTVWYTDPQNSNNPVQINQGPNYYTCCPWIQFNNHSAASFGNVSASSNPVCASTGINFSADFTQLEANATGMAANQNNVTLKYNGLTLSIGSILSLGIITSQVDITLAPGVNFLNLTGAQLNALQNINITNGIDATRTLIINVNDPGTFNWNVHTLNGNIDPAYMLYNFSNTTTLNINNGQNIRGTLFAPKADVNKTLYNDIQGQVVAKSFINAGNNIQGTYFNNSNVPGGNGAASATVVAFTINNNTQCRAGNAFMFTNSSTGSGTLTYAWNFGDGTTSTSASPTKSYAAAGTYSVKLVTTGSGGKDSVTKTVTVNAQPSTGFTINNSSQNLSGNSFTFTSTNASPGNSYSWKFRDNGATGSGANATRAFSGVGVYDVTQMVTSSDGCKDSTTQRITVRAGSCSPTEPAWGFNVFVRNNANLIAPHTEGGVAAGGNLIIGGSYATALNSVGTFRANGVPVSLLVGGKIDPSSTSGTSFQVLTGTIAKIGDSTGYDVWYKDNNNAYAPIRIAPDGNYSGTPVIDFSSTANAFSPELSATENPIFQSGLIDFSAEFVKLKSYSTNMSAYVNNVTLYTSSNLTTSYPGNNVPAGNQVYVSLANGINVLNITGANLNNFQSLTFQGGAPSANKILLVNVDAPGTFNWTVTNSTGAGATDGQYILYNFPNTTQLNIVGQSAVLGTVFAPYADIDKTVNQGNIDGQIIGQSYKHNGGEDHPQYFNSSLLNMCVQPVIASFTINNQTQCLAGNNFQFTSASTGAAPLTYKWSFGDNTTSTTANPSHTYTAAGSYTVKLVITDNNGSKDSTTKTVTANAQPTATFSVNAAAQLLLGNNFSFTAAGQVAGNTYLWTLGDGTTSASANITGKTYGTAGTYTVKLVVTNANGCKDSSTQIVTVGLNPTVALPGINLPTQCLVGNSFVFTNASVGIPPLSYFWDFGDGTTSTLPLPLKVYAAAGMYNVKLVVTSGLGGKDSSLVAVTVSAPPIPLFTVNSSTQVLGGNSFNFAAAAQVAGNVYLWNFGDGTTSASASVNGKVYAAPGTYNVKLVITNANGCKDSSTQIVVVLPNGPLVSASVNLGAQCLVGNSFVFANASVGTGLLNYFWDFGDGTTSTLLNPVKVYAAAGVYPVKLVVADLNGLKDSLTLNATVHAQPLPSFSINASTQLFIGNSFNFLPTLQAAGNVYLWNFGDGTTSTSASITGKAYTAPGTYNVKLVITNANGCKDSSTQVVTVNANATVSLPGVNLPTQCLVGNSFLFTNVSVGVPPLSYHWDFGDGSTSNALLPVKVYAAAGVYNVKLVVTVGLGTKDSSLLTVNVNAQPLPLFTVNASTQVLLGNSFNLAAAAQVAGNVYLWNFGDGTTSASASVTGKAYAAPGTYTVKLVVTTANGCKDSSVQVVVVLPNGPLVSASVNLGAQCLVGNSFVFANASIGTGLLNYFWDFGDGTTSTLAAPIKVYAAAGVYPVKLIVADINGLKDSLTLNLTVHAQPLPSFSVNASTQVLLGNSFNFLPTLQAAGNVYFWNFGDGTTSASASVTGKAYTAAGTYNVKLIVTSANGCKDSSTVVIIVNPNPAVAPTASFTVNDPAQCLTGNVFAFTSTSTGNNLTYNWNFGDGTSSAVANPTHTYASAGSYTVTLTVTNGAGSASTQQTVTIYPSASAGFAVSPSATQYLTGNSFMFTSNNPQVGNSYAWDFGDGMTETSENTTHSYTVAGPYVVRQIVTNANSCKDTAYQDVTVLSDSVGSGNGGGLESDGLGGLVTRRNFNRLKYSLNGTFNVLNAPVFDVPLYASKGAAAVQELSDMMPANLAAGDVPRISTPTDLTALTIAKEALSVDYTRKNVTKASVLGIQTEGRAYNHTKSICDRFKGGTILNIQQTNVRGFDFSRYAIRQANGIVEYAIAFAAGKKTGDVAYRLQTGWVISRYAKDDTVFNFQVWATAPADVDKLAGDILDKLSEARPLSVARSADNLPAAYITKGVRHKDTLLLTLRNTTGIANGQVAFEERTNELAGQQTRVLPVTYKANGDAVVAVPIGDGYEYEGLLYLGDSLVDQVYLADGNWGLDYDKEYTSVKVYEPANNPTRIYNDDELPVYRSVTLTAVSDDYITLYKALLPGTEPLDLTEYHTLKFRATGNGNVIIRMSRDSITSWNAQYKTTQMLVQEGKDYEIAFEDFVSDKLTAPFYPKDVKTLDFTMLANGKKAQFDIKLENVAFAKKKSTGLLALQSKKLSVAPNPIKGPFTVTYASDAARSLMLSVSDISGRVLYSQVVNAVVGTNTLTVDLKSDLPTGTILFVSLRGEDDTRYETTKVSAQ